MKCIRCHKDRREWHPDATVCLRCLTHPELARKKKRVSKDPARWAAHRAWINHVYRTVGGKAMKTEGELELDACVRIVEMWWRRHRTKLGEQPQELIDMLRARKAEFMAQKKEAKSEFSRNPR